MSYESLPILSQDQLNALQELSVPGQSNLLKELTALFIQTAIETLENLRQAIACEDFVSIGMLAHKLKGSGANLGAVRLHALCQELEDNVYVQCNDKLNFLYHKISECLAETYQALLRESQS